MALLAAATLIYADDIPESEAEAIRKALEAFASIPARIDRFGLWNACKPIHLVVEHTGDDAVRMGLTQRAIATTVRSRLRATRLYGSSGGGGSGSNPSLYVNVSTVGNRGAGFNVNLGFLKYVSDPISGEEGHATTWHRGVVGQSRDVGYILSGVSQLADEFIDEYLRVNEPACPRSLIVPR